ncbi:MAG: carbohydrate kinase family protein [Sedimentisphaerales bacterium]|nr:carbohydrate kinase family protein [Sedimentisphaerales bacterium]
MSVDVLILNTAVADLRSDAFAFADKLVGPGGLAKCRTVDMPDYSQRQYHDWISRGLATAGGPGNTAPLMARAGLRVAVGVNLGKGEFDGLDAQGRFFYDTMKANHVDMTETVIHGRLPTGTTFIYDKGEHERGGIAYFPNANNDFDFNRFRGAIERLKPGIVYYMYSGLSDRGDAHGGKDLADFIRWCREQGCVTIVDSHTLTGNPHALIRSGKPVPEYALLEPLLGELDLFFTSSDEAQMIENTLDRPRDWSQCSEEENVSNFLRFLSSRFWGSRDRTRLFGVTVSNGAWQTHISRGNSSTAPSKTRSRFMVGDVIDLVGAGDSFRAGFISYIARHIDAFRAGGCDFDQAIQMGNLFASLFIKAPLQDRYGNITDFGKMLSVITRERDYKDLKELLTALR